MRLEIKLTTCLDDLVLVGHAARCEAVGSERFLQQNRGCLRSSNSLDSLPWVTVGSTHMQIKILNPCKVVTDINSRCENVISNFVLYLGDQRAHTGDSTAAGRLTACTAVTV